MRSEKNQLSSSSRNFPIIFPMLFFGSSPMHSDRKEVGRGAETDALLRATLWRRLRNERRSTHTWCRSVMQLITRKRIYARAHTRTVNQARSALPIDSNAHLPYILDNYIMGPTLKHVSRRTFYHFPRVQSSTGTSIADWFSRSISIDSR